MGALHRPVHILVLLDHVSILLAHLWRLHFALDVAALCPTKGLLKVAAHIGVVRRLEGVLRQVVPSKLLAHETPAAEQLRPKALASVLRAMAWP